MIGWFSFGMGYYMERRLIKVLFGDRLLVAELECELTTVAGVLVGVHYDPLDETVSVYDVETGVCLFQRGYSTGSSASKQEALSVMQDRIEHGFLTVSYVRQRLDEYVRTKREELEKQLAGLPVFPLNDCAQ